MRDNDLFKNIGVVLNAGLAAQNITDVRVQQSYQPRNKGANYGQNVYVHKLGDHRYGFLQRTNVWNPDTSQMVHTETQIYETMFQINALSIQDPATATQLTASDLVNAAAAIMQSDDTISFLLSQGLAIYRITDVRNPYFMDDKERFEASPSFDFTLQHQQVIISESLAAEKIVVNIDRV